MAKADRKRTTKAKTPRRTLQRVPSEAVAQEPEAAARPAMTERVSSDRPPSVEPLGPLETLVPREVFERAKSLAQSDTARLKRRLRTFGRSGAEHASIVDLISALHADVDGADQFAELLALLVLMQEAADAANCDCSKELAALIAAQQALDAAQQALAAAQQGLAADQAQLAAAQAAEQAALNAYQAAQRLVDDECSGIIGHIDPFCLIAITYEVMLGNKWAARFLAVQGWQTAVNADLALVALRQAAVTRATQTFFNALNAYLACLARCL